MSLFPSDPRPSGGAPRARLALGALVLAIGVSAVAFLEPTRVLQAVLATVAALGIWGPVLFIGVYVVATVCFVPGSVLTLGAGALFGVGWGSVYVSLAATLGATMAFLVGRHLARDWVTRRIAGNAAFAAIDRAVGEEGWKIVGLTRLSPVFPFTLLNYAFGLTRVSLRDYVLASWIGMMPGTVLYVYLGSIARAGATAAERSPAQWAVYAAGLAATVAVTVVITRLARRALARRTRMEAVK